MNSIAPNHECYYGAQPTLHSLVCCDYYCWCYLWFNFKIKSSVSKMLSFVICDIYNNSLGLLSAGSNGLLTCTRLHIWHSGWFLVSFSRAIFVFCIVPPFWFCYDRRSLVCELPNCMMMGQDMHELIMLWWADLFICQGENSFEMEEGVGDSDGNLLFCPWITMKRASKVYLHHPVCMYVCMCYGRKVRSCCLWLVPQNLLY